MSRRPPPPPSALTPFLFEPCPPSLKAHFDAIPWTKQYTSDPALEPYTTTARIFDPRTTGNTLIANTFNTKDTVTAWQCWWRPAPESQSTSTSSESEIGKSEVPKKYGESIALLSFSGGLNGHPDTLHGGFLSVALDELMGNAAEYERPHNKSSMTAYLKVDYKRPIRTPGTIMVKTWVNKVQGRKIYARGEVLDKDGHVCSTAEALFVAVPRVEGVKDGKSKL